MKVDDLVKAVVGLEPMALREFFDKAGSAFARKAEAVYDKNQEENGPLAQPYADIADLCNDAAFAFDEDAGAASLDSENAPSQAPPTTVTAAVELRTPPPGSNPWGGRRR